MTSPEVAALVAPPTGEVSARLLLIPLGSTEQHGPHLPLETDSLIAEAWARGVARHLPGATVAPTVAYGSSGEHQSFAGTLSIGGPALHSLVVELVRSASLTFPRMALLSGHAGNLEPLRRAVAQLRRQGHDVWWFVPTWPTGAERSTPATESDPPPIPIDAHAGRTETSLMLHLQPGLVRMERIRAGSVEPIGQLMERLTASGVGAVSPNGVLGDPTGASAEEGRQLLDDLVARTVDRLS